MLNYYADSVKEYYFIYLIKSKIKLRLSVESNMFKNIQELTLFQTNGITLYIMSRA